jgi:hypothetical protein
MTPREIIAKEIRPLDGECADNLIEALHSAGYRILGPGEWDKETGWQPIETAPKDGTRVILWAPDYCDYAVGGEWCDRVGAWDAECGMMDDGPAMFEDECDGPTHWRPFPAPPAIRALAKEKHG